MSAPEPAVPVDPEILEMLAELQEPGEPDLLRELITLFLRDTPERLDALRSALAGGDFATAARAAHSVKGSAGNLGASELQDLAAAAEEHAREARASDVAAGLARLEREFGRVHQYLSELLSTRPH